MLNLSELMELTVLCLWSGESNKSTFWPTWFCHQTRLKVNPTYLKVNRVSPIECFVALMVGFLS